jgi:hypothetical protein
MRASVANSAQLPTIKPVPSATVPRTSCCTLSSSSRVPCNRAPKTSAGTFNASSTKRVSHLPACAGTRPLSGYYQKAFDQLRDVIETYFFVDYLSTYPKKIDEEFLVRGLGTVRSLRVRLLICRPPLPKRPPATTRMQKSG